MGDASLTPQWLEDLRRNSPVHADGRRPSADDRLMLMIADKLQNFEYTVHVKHEDPHEELGAAKEICFTLGEVYAGRGRREVRLTFSFYDGGKDFVEVGPCTEMNLRGILDRTQRATLRELFDAVDGRKDEMVAEKKRQTQLQGAALFLDQLENGSKRSFL